MGQVTEYDLRLSNERGADRIENLPREHSGLERDDHVLGLLVDLRHYCDRSGLDFDELNNNAYALYTSEIHGGLFKCGKATT